MSKTFYDVPAGTNAAQCNGPNCHAKIYFITHPLRGTPYPIDCDVDGGAEPSETSDKTQLGLLVGMGGAHDGKGVSHFTTCADAAMFTRKPKR